MPEFMRVKWRDSGTEQSIPKPGDPDAIDHEAYEVLDGDATDYNGREIDPVLPGEEPPGEPSLDDHTVDELKAEIERRNTGRAEADLIPTKGNKPDLIKAIQADDSKGDS